MSLDEIVKIIFGAGVVSWLLNLFKDFYQDWKSRKLRARQQAFEVSNSLMKLSLKCNRIITLHEANEIMKGPYELVIPTFPKDDFLEMIDGLTDLHDADVAEIADLEMQRLTEETYLAFIWSVTGDRIDISDSEVSRLKNLKNDASRLAGKIRNRYDLPSFRFKNNLVIENVQ